MPDAKYDNVIACCDYNVTGEPCPFFSGDKCNILGWSSPLEAPEGYTCDKAEGGPITKTTALLFGLEDEYLAEMKRLHGSDSYGRFRAAMDHYALPEAERLRVELEALYQKVMGQGRLSKRDFMKKFKPNNIGVGEDEPPSFRMRVLTWLRDRARMSRITEQSSSVPPETVAIIPYIERERWVENGAEEVEEYLQVKVLTRDTSLQEEIDMSGLDCWDGFKELCEQYIDKKMLLRVEYFYSPGSYYHPNDVDFGINDITVIRVLP